MASNHKLQNIFQLLSQRIKNSFDGSVVFDAIVKSVGPRSFIIATEDGQKEIECRTTKSISDLIEGEGIRLMGSLHLRSNGNVLIKADDFYAIDKNFWYNKKAKIYNKLREYLLHEKRQKYISRMNEKMKIPKIISNIGLIVPPDRSTDLTNFKISFQENCKGSLYIYHLKKNTMESDIRTAIEYFKKYHYIDLICILMSQLSTDDVFTFSSKDNLIYFLNRKNCPFITSITPNHPNSIQFPLLPMVVNQNFDKISECTNCIRESQIEMEKLVNDSIERGHRHLNKKINLYTKKVFQKELLLAELMPNMNPIERIKKHLIRNLDSKKEQLEKIEVEMMQNIVEDERIQQIIEAEKRIMGQTN